jgi:DNA ligase D-like protein (predicted 3'-phosphoesterase)
VNCLWRSTPRAGRRTCWRDEPRLAARSCPQGPYEGYGVALFVGTGNHAGRLYCRVVVMSHFVVQCHDATTLHFDLRIQAGEVLRSWAVPKGPSLDPGVRRLAVAVDDHALSAGDFEGVHEGQSRGSGAVIIWDEGDAEIMSDEPGHLSFTLYGRKLSGRFGLTRTGQRRWILVKVRDEHARAGSDIVAERPASVRSGKTWQDLKNEQTRNGGS